MVQYARASNENFPTNEELLKTTGSGLVIGDEVKVVDSGLVFVWAGEQWGWVPRDEVATKPDDGELMNYSHQREAEKMERDRYEDWLTIQAMNGVNGARSIVPEDFEDFLRLVGQMRDKITSYRS